MNKVVKPISFNPSDPFEARLLQFLEGQGKFATYMKRLLAREMEGTPATVRYAAPIVPPVAPITVSSNLRPRTQEEAPTDTGEDFLQGMV